MQKQVIVGSLNPVKIEAARLAFARVWPDQEWTVTGIAVPSGVSDQPMSFAESIRGARTRASNALAASTADYAVGLEGGLQQVEGQWYDFGWIVVRDSAGNEGIGSTIGMAVPPLMITMIQQGMELGDVIDAVFGRENSKQSNGHFGLMTHDALTRASAYADGVISALTHFIQPQLFEQPALTHENS
jgi:inosine/xanthosine triphosphatase